MVKHESSYFHKAATEALKATNDVADMLSQAATEALKATNDVADMLSKAESTEKKNNREYLLKIITSIRFLGRQGLPLRGDGPHNDLDSNFYQLLLLRAEDFQGINVLKTTTDDIHFS